MKWLHLADLHLGKRVHEFSLIEDQRYILKQILEVMETEQVDGVLIAGDIYDRMIPSAEAVQLFDDFLTKIVGKKLPVFLISGNHDSAERLSFGAQIFARNSVYFSTGYQGHVESVSLEDSYGTVTIYLLPFIKPVFVRQAFPDRAEEIVSYQDALRIVMEHSSVNPAKRNILLAHQFVTGARSCESEELSVGGLDQVDASLFAPFDYVALGHMHGPQCVGRETVRYAGTPLKYSFSEAGHQKSVTIAELREKGDVRIKAIPLRPLHDMRILRGTYEELTRRSMYEHTDIQDYVQVTLTDEEDVFDALGKLRTIYPNLMKLDYDNQRTRNNTDVTCVSSMRQKTPVALVKELFELQNQKPLSDGQENYVKKLIEKIWEEQI